MKEFTTLSLHHKSKDRFGWHVIDTFSGRIVAKFRFPQQAEAFIYFKPYLQAGIDAVPKGVRDFFEVTK